jgi:hypothetical protein
LPGDLLNIVSVPGDSVAFTGGPTSDSGAFVVNSNQPISFVHIESLQVTGGGTPGHGGSDDPEVVSLFVRKMPLIGRGWPGNSASRQSRLDQGQTNPFSENCQNAFMHHERRLGPGRPRCAFDSNLRRNHRFPSCSGRDPPMRPQTRVTSAYANTKRTHLLQTGFVVD